MSSQPAIPTVVLVERLRSRESVPLTTNTFRCNERFQEFCALVLPDLTSSAKRQRDLDKEEKVRQAAERAIKEIRTYGFELRKAVAIEKTSERDMEEYSQQGDHIKESIRGVQEEIGKLKEGLVEEKKKRFNKEIYEETCKDINKYPPHKRTKMATEKLRSELSATWEKQKTVQSEQKLKQKQIALLMQSIADVQAAVHEGDMEDAPTTGALEAAYPEEDQEADEHADEDADADDAENEPDEDDDDDPNAPNDIGEDGELEEEAPRRRRRKSSPSLEGKDLDSDMDGKIGARFNNGISSPRLKVSERRSSGGGDGQLPDVA